MASTLRPHRQHRVVVGPARRQDTRRLQLSDVSARWRALRAAASRRETDAPQTRTRAQLNNPIEKLKERLSRLLEYKQTLKLTASERHALDEEDEDSGLAAHFSALLAARNDAHQRSLNELISLEKTLCAWAEWESALCELQGALLGDLETLMSLRDRGRDPTDVAAQIRQLAASLVDKKGGSTCDSLSDSGISDGDSEGAGDRARRLSALKQLASRLQAVLAPNSPAHKTIAKRMELTENYVRSLQDSCRALVKQTSPGDSIDHVRKDKKEARSRESGAGKKPDYGRGKGGWVWRVLRMSLPIQLCLLALLLSALVNNSPQCCDHMNSLADYLTPQLRYVRGPPPV